MNTHKHDASHPALRDHKPIAWDRRAFLRTAVTTAAGAFVAPALSAAERDWSEQKPVRYPDPDIVVLDPRFEKYRQFNAAIERLWTGARWAEGPVWFGDGRETDRQDPLARGLRQCLFWRRQTEPVIHDRQPVALRALCKYPGRPDAVKQKPFSLPNKKALP